MHIENYTTIATSEQSFRYQAKKLKRKERTRQLALFDDPLEIEAVPLDKRIHPVYVCRLVHYDSGLKLPGQFTFSEASAKMQFQRQCQSRTPSYSYHNGNRYPGIVERWNLNKI